MSIELEIIRGIQSFRFGFLDTVMMILTQLGDQFAFIAVGLVIYWFFDKKLAFKLVFVFIISALANEAFKVLIKRPRPFIEDASLLVGEATHGYSMPSGHAQNTAVISTTLYQAYGKKSRWLKWVLWIALIIVPFTRLYLGQHYVSDVIFGVLLGIVFAFMIGKLVDLMKDKEHLYGLFVMIPLAIITLIMGLFDPVYDEVKNMFVAVGGMTGFLVGYAIDKVFIQYHLKPQGIKILYRALIGLLGVVILYLGLSVLFDFIAQDNIYLDFIRYAMIGLFGAAGSMYVFKLLKV